MTDRFDEFKRRSEQQWQALQSAPVPRILVGTATCGRSAGALEVVEAFRRELDARGLEANLLEVGCIGLCYAEPIVSIAKPSRPEICYANVTADFGDFNLTFYCSTQMGLRQEMLFHGEEGSIEVSSPFNASDYAYAAVTWHDQNRSRSEVYRFVSERQYRNMVETFASAARIGEGDLFTLEDSKANQKLIDAVYRAGEKDGWEPV